MPVGGGTPKRITQLAPSYLHSWSPDGESLIYTGGRNGEFDIYRIASDGSGTEVNLTNSKGSTMARSTRRMASTSTSIRCAAG